MIKISRNDIQIKAKINRGKVTMIAAMTEQVVKDGNIFCRQDTGMLMSSAISSSLPQQGLAIWNTPYAKRVYYTGTPVKDVNPNASLMWVEKARATYRKDWEKIAQKSFEGGINE